MTPTLRRPASAIGPALVLALLLVPALALTGTRPERPFSRSRWIAEHRDVYHFDGGVIPADRERLLRFNEKVGTVARAGGKKVPPEKSIRVSGDLLEGAGGSEPETQTETFLALNPANDRHLLAGYQESRFVDGGARGLAFAVSTDSGKTWTEGVIPGLTKAADGPFDRASDPWVAFGPNNRAYFLSIAFNETNPANGVFLSSSEDGGRTWGTPVTVHANSDDFDDKESMTVDTRSDSPYLGRVYVTWDTAARNSQVLYVATSEDGGRSFRAPVAIDSGDFNIGVVPLVGPGGVVHAIWAKFVGRQTLLMASSSNDGGETWSSPRMISESRGLGIEGFRTGDAIPSAAIDPVRGDLYVVWQDARFTPGADQVVLSKSTDGGQTWTAPLRISDGPADAPAFTPAVAVDRNGRAGVCYSSLRNDPNRQVLIDQYCTFNRRRGGPFRASQRVNATSFDIRFAAVADAGYFLGDYQGMVGSPLGFSPLFVATLKPSARNPDLRQPDAFTRLMKP